MKNSNKKNYKKPNYLKAIKSGLFLIITIFFLKANSINASNGKLLKFNNSISEITIDPVYNQLFNAIKSGRKCYNVKVTSVSVKNNNYAFTSFSVGFLRIQSGYNIAISGLQTEFDDRSNFRGAKTVENLVIYKNGKYSIGMTVNMRTWGNKTIKLKNVKITKEPYGYFITGKATDGNRTVYYTLGIYETTCLI
ncbi:hypothetical protein [Lutibacter sp.]|uniref:hypothetical protein n=1 Tax=Lutibacter sp. TaxID=1925666 RepID=UPI0025BAEA4C|nr:hypothetical protein [Lutibacter sp.]MCF6182589.1 hypothetical protein [Lutibacter sp.]